jgi:leucine-rich repeat protein SHOC2
MIPAEVEDTIATANRLKVSTLYFSSRNLTSFPESLVKLTHLSELHLENNQLTTLPDSITKLANLSELHLENNQLTTLPDSITKLANLNQLYLNGNPLKDLSILQIVPRLQKVVFLEVALPYRYWIKLSDWKPEWLLDEENEEIRSILIRQVGYEKICKKLGAVTINMWREYTLLSINDIEKIFDEDGEHDTEPMVLLKMTCPSTQHIHILRVPPEMTSAEAAITWVNHGIHPDEFAVQT